MNGWHSRPDEEGEKHGGRVIGKMQKNREDAGGVGNGIKARDWKS